MRKRWVAVLLVLVALGILFTAIYFWRSASGEPKLKVDFNPKSRSVYAGGNFMLNITIINEGNSSAKNVNLTLTAPAVFTISESGTNNYTTVFPNIGVGEKQSVALTLTVSQKASTGKYFLDVKIFAENLPKPLSSKYEVEVRLPVS
ncbi:MAG: NEW3 domain-containing protein [Candidatus Bathyarchaeia archaeon]